MTGKSWTMVIFVSCILSVLCSNAQAQITQDRSESANDQADIMTVVNDAITLYQAGSYKDAIEKFQEAYTLYADANILFNIARCYHMLGDKANATNYYRQFIDDPSVPPDAKLRAENHLKELSEEESPEVVTKTGPQKPAPSQDSPEMKDTLEDAPAETTQSNFNNTETPTDSSRRGRVAGWTLVGTGVAALVAAGALYGTTLAKYNDFKESKAFEEKESTKDDTKTLAVAGDICLGVGLATAAVGIAMLVIKARAESSDNSASAVYTSAWVTPRDGGVSWSIRF